VRLLKLIFIILIFNTFLFAKIELNSSNIFIEGEAFVFEFEVSGSSVEFPNIDKIGPYVVEQLGTSNSLQLINGNYSEKITKKYRIFPTADFTIPSFEFKIDGQIEKSDERKVIKSTALKTKSQSFDLTISSSKNELYVGEATVLKLAFKYKKGLQITNLGFSQPHFEGFWYKALEDKSTRYEQGSYIVQELQYLLFPQKSGELKINPLKVDVQMIEQNGTRAFGFFTNVPKVYKVYSNELNFKVSSLPNGVDLIGNFDINATVDKTKIKEGESIAYKLSISGMGNFDDILDKKLDIDNAVVYDNKPKIDTRYENGSYLGDYEKVYSIVPSEDIIIPAQTIRYFDQNSKKIVEKKTQEFKIEVENKKVEKPVVLQKGEKQEDDNDRVTSSNTNDGDKIFYFVLGALSSLLIIGLLSLVKIKKTKKTKVETPLIKQIKNTKDKRELLKVLVPHINKDSKLDELIYACESDTEFTSLKKDIISKIKSLKI